MAGTIRTYTYDFQPDFLAEIEQARALTPPDILAANEARRRPRTAVTERISRLNLIPLDDSPIERRSPTSLNHHRPFPRPRSIRPPTVGSHSSQGFALPFSSSQYLRAVITTPNRSNSSGASSTMARPGSSNRPTHIPLPSGGFTGRSPNDSPLNTPASPTSPRSSFLPSFMRTRSRAATMTNVNAGRAGSPSIEAANPLGGTMSRAQNSSNQSTSVPTSNSVTRSVSTPLSGNMANGAEASAADAEVAPPTAADGSVRTYRIRLVPHLETSRSLAFDPVVRELMPIHVPPGIAPSVAAASISTPGAAVNGRPPALVLKIGRFTDKTPSAGAAAAAAATISAGNTSSAGAVSGMSGIAGPTLTIAGGGGDVCSGKVAFKSKVVSRAHAEIWCESGGKFYIRDTSSSSGTFLNHIRLSSPNTDSRPTTLNDGDVLQLGVDYQGGHEDMFRCVKIRVELGREWQRAANEFNTNALKQLKELGGGLDTPTKAAESDLAGSSKKGKTNVTDCCICLFSVTVCQSLFIAPCSHVFHYKCIRPLLMQHHPGFSCPLCRTFANLEEDVETEDAWEIASRRASVISRKPSNHSIRLPPATDRAPAHPGVDAPNGQPSTVVGFGASTASIDDLLAGGSDGNSSESAAMANSTISLQPHPPALQRQATAVQGDDEVYTPQTGVSGGAASTLCDDSSSAPVTSTSAVESRAIPSASIDPFGSMAEVQTPMNDTFLSTLAPSVHQRLDLARQMDRVGLGSEPVEEEPTGVEEAENDSGSARRTSDEGWLQVDREDHGAADRDLTDERREMDMMFT